VQNFFHQFDRYANPVTLTYNQQRSLKSVPGGVCSIITFILLWYYIIATLTDRIVKPTYYETAETDVVYGDGAVPSIFNITQDQLHFYAGVSSYNDTIA